MSDEWTDVPLQLTNSYLPQSYDLSLKIDHAKPNFQGQLRIPLAQNRSYTGDSDSAFSFSLHAHKLVITSAALTTNDNEDEKLKISYDRAHQRAVFSSEKVLSGSQLSISFVGLITSIKTFHDETYGLFKTNYSDSVTGRSDNHVIATHTQPFGCRMIFPVVDELISKVPITLSVTAKSLFKVVSNAPLDSVNVVDMTEYSVFKFKQTPPIAPSVFGFVVGDLEKVESSGSPVPVRAFVTKGDLSYALYALKIATRLLPVFENVLGVKYPMEKLDIVTLPFLSDAVMENWGMITAIKDTVYLDESSAPAEAKAHVRQLIAHQLTHQWIGNLISVDEWKYTWLIEAFATFVGNYVLSIAAIEVSDKSDYDSSKLAALQDFMDADCFINQLIPSFHEHMNLLKVNQSSKTSTIFERNFYDKGMILLNMIASLFKLESTEQDFSSFFKAFAHVLMKFEHKTVKPFEFWNVLNEHTSYELLTFIHSWTRYTGYPYLKVKLVTNKIVVEQNRFLFNENAEDLQLENNPYHVPLALKVKSDNGQVRVANLMLTDRSMELDIPPAQFLSLNADNQFYYKTIYAPELQEVILENVLSNSYSSLDLVGMIKDYGKVLGQPLPKQDAALFAENQLSFLMRLCDQLANESLNTDFEVLKCALGYIEIINAIFVHFTEYTKFQKWLDALAVKLFKKIAFWEDSVLSLESGEYNKVEFEVRNIVLQLAIRNKEAQNICRKLYKNLMSSGVTQKFVPKELYSLVFNVTMATANMTEYKQILSLVKNGDVSFLKHTNGTASEIQTAAVSSLSFCQKKDLLSKTLHFVNNNIDSKMIELALIGFKYKPEAEFKLIIWTWYKTNYDGWVKRSLRKGSDWSKQIGITVSNITRLVLGEVMQYKREEALRFVSEKCKSLPPHQLQEKFLEVEAENDEKVRIAEYYDKIM
ncbi:hypothetical protein METBIDRAFT_35983 [Metschnikowia bicuspidata var. bicuspidata NRRL YB-4993]|uniref:Aminopeptidase n=1 Tax=Metschnikowia bicuspidata var. bicuspidata NRRL YB-4993 TaxID=869754 RepID=A0A1A0HJL1_9ASCO|nr:hypothetical protein METBIDRAFT_35983 [Metschnikowia bicuspidata var. bicuspidata NRRL YB-4993]OBA24200.1 hypothetical protein METBIDRAFT_35983 [Metschnikowia bicuspidata var. bicuspidata NRRL YB-4993]